MSANALLDHEPTVNVSYTVPTPPVPIPSVEVRANSTYNGVNVPVSIMGSVQ